MVPCARCYHDAVDRDDILAFTRRDWARLAHAKAEHWLSLKRRLTPTAILALGDELRRHAIDVRPDRPDAADRAADMAVHVRVSEALRAVLPRSR